MAAVCSGSSRRTRVCSCRTERQSRAESQAILLLCTHTEYSSTVATIIILLLLIPFTKRASSTVATIIIHIILCITVYYCRPPTVDVQVVCVWGTAVGGW